MYKKLKQSEKEVKGIYHVYEEKLINKQEIIDKLIKDKEMYLKAMEDQRGSVEFEENNKELEDQI